MLLGRSLGAWIRQFFVCMGGCLGCCTKATPVIAVDEPTKGLRIQGRTVKKPSVSEDYFWSTSTCEMENSALQSQRSLSSISVPIQTLEAHNGASSSSPDFVNHGYLIWKQTRQQWVANKKTRNKAQQSREPRLSQYCVCNVKSLWLCSWNVTYDSLLGNNKPFHQPIPLSEMVDFLVDVWEQEGMYD